MTDAHVALDTATSTETSRPAAELSLLDEHARLMERVAVDLHALHRDGLKRLDRAIVLVQEIRCTLDEENSIPGPHMIRRLERALRLARSYFGEAMGWEIQKVAEGMGHQVQEGAVQP